MLSKKEPVSFERQLLKSCPALAQWQRLYENEEEAEDERVPAGDHEEEDMGGGDAPESEPDDMGGEPEDMGGEEESPDEDAEDKLDHPIDPNDPAMIAHEIGELKTLCDKGKHDLVKKQLHHLWSQVKHMDKIHDGDDEAIAEM